MISSIKTWLSKPTTHKIVVTLYDALIGAICMYLVTHWRYTFEDKPIPEGIAESATFVFFISCIASWIITDSYKAIWRFTSLDDMKALLQAVILATILTPLILFISTRAEFFPRSVPFLVGPLFFFALVINRAVILFAFNGDIRALFRGQNPDLPNAILIGTEESLHNYLRDINRKTEGPAYNIKGLISTNTDRKDRSIRSIPILGKLDDLDIIFDSLKKRYDTPITLIAADRHQERGKSYNLVRKASELGAPLVRVTQSRPDTLTPFEAADLIGRELKALDIGPVRRFIFQKNILITGAGGSIGSEITRQIAALSPNKLILLDNSEYNLYEIDRVLKQFSTNNKLKWIPLLADINDPDRLEEIFSNYQPDIIIHTAAMKHVPLSEINPIEALRSNIGGTQNILNLAKKYEAESFTLISSDKAVKPSNIMGASKRIAEMLTMYETLDNKLSACAVRFGNVLASTGSVIPLFEEQIALGGPVTVTHEDVTRYFMTTEEAAALVLQAAALNASERPELGSIYVLEMGEPVKINKLARQLIRLRGFVPDRDIKITYTGLRPGEKMNEELTHYEEQLEKTYVEGIQRFTGHMKSSKTIKGHIDKLLEDITMRDRSAIKKTLAKLIPDYKLNGYLNTESSQSNNVTQLHAKSKS